jgi:hypothetical protein
VAWDGTAMLAGGGTLLLGSEYNKIGPGDQKIVRDGNNVFLNIFYLTIPSLFQRLEGIF